MTPIYWKKIPAEVQLIHAEQMSLCNFIILRKKRDSNTGIFLWNSWTFKNSGGCFWKHTRYYYVIKIYVGHKLTIFNCSCCIILIWIDTFFKEYQERFSKFAFQEVARPFGQPNKHVFEILFARRHILVTQNCRTKVLGYSTSCCFIVILL